MICPAGPATPTGLGEPAARGAGAKALPRTQAAMAAAAAHATGRQRRDGSDPVGKSSKTKITNPMPKNQSQPSQLPQARAGGNCCSSSPTVASAYESPVADKSQPIGFAGRFHASSAPTVAKPTMNVTATVPSTAFPVPPLRFAGSG
jgi:hypothetical protein